MQSDSLFSIIARYFWLMCIVINCVNAYIGWRRVQPAIAKSPQREAGYRRLAKGWLIHGSIPWVVMGIGVMYGGVPGVFHYFNAKNGPYVIAWYVSLVALWLLLGWWLFARRGAEELVEHPGMLTGNVQNPAHVKMLFLVMVSAGVIVLSVFIFGNLEP